MLLDQDRTRADDLIRSIALVRDQWNGGQSRFGPVREPLAYPILPAGEAEEIAERRFGPFLRSIRTASRIVEVLR